MIAVDWPAVRRRSEQAPWSGYRAATLRLAESLLTAPPPRVDCARHNWVLEQVRVLGKYVVTLAGAYRLTGDSRFAERAWFFFADSLEWSHWYWLGDPNTLGYALSNGEMAVTCGFIHDWMGDYLSAERQESFSRAIRERVFEPYLEVTAPEKEAIWYRLAMNWNPVCSGGALALAALRGDREPLGPAVMARAQAGLEFYIAGMPRDGSSLESIAYWQYGVIHLAYALFALERAGGRPHPAFAAGMLNQGLSFPFDFTPEGGDAIGFGDGNHFDPQGWLFALAERAGRSDITVELHRRIGRQLAALSVQPFDPFHDYHPTEIFSAVFSGRATAEVRPRPVAKIYPETGWGVFAAGGLSLAFRAGSTDVPHSMRDLGAVNLAAGGVSLLEYVENHPYTRGWFNAAGPRGESRSLYFEDNSVSKNTLLANGVGQIVRVRSEWGYGAETMWCEAGPAYPSFVRTACRRVTVLPAGFRVDDEVATDADCWHEARFFTRGEFTVLGAGRIRVSRGGESALLQIEAAAAMDVSVTAAAPSIPVRAPLQLLRIFNRAPAARSRWTLHVGR